MISYMVHKGIQTKRMYAKSNASLMKLKNGGRNMEYSSKYLSTYWCTSLATEGWRQRHLLLSTESQSSHRMKPNTSESSLIKNYDSSRTYNMSLKKALTQQWHCPVSQKALGVPHTRMYDNYFRPSLCLAQTMQL